MARGAHIITEQFEQELCKYTGAPYAVAVDNCSNALFLALMWTGYKGEIEIPKHCYPSVPCEIIHAGCTVKFYDNPIDKPGMLRGAYRLFPLRVFDSALMFTTDMYKKDELICLSFTGPYKHLKLGKGGAILTDDERAYKWLKKARFSGRDECSYHEDDFDKNPVIGWNFYMMPEIAARGILLMQQFYNFDGSKKHNEDLELPYPDLSKFNLWKS